MSVASSTDFALKTILSIPWTVVAPISIATAGFCLSVVMAIVQLFDRRRKLIIRSRKGKWVEQSGEIIHGVLEIYNLSIRANAIRGYRFLARDKRGKFLELESEHYRFVEKSKEEIHNETPLVISPYSGVAVQVACFGKWREFPKDLELKVFIEDVGGKLFSGKVQILNRYAAATQQTSA